MSIAGSSWASSYRTNQTNTAMPAATSAITHHQAAGPRCSSPIMRIHASPPVTRSSPHARITNPHVSSVRPGSGVDSGTNSQITTAMRVTAIAGTSSVVVRSADAAKMRPAARAPTIAPA